MILALILCLHAAPSLLAATIEPTPIVAGTRLLDAGTPVHQDGGQLSASVYCISSLGEPGGLGFVAGFSGIVSLARPIAVGFSLPGVERSGTSRAGVAMTPGPMRVHVRGAHPSIPWAAVTLTAARDLGVALDPLDRLSWELRGAASLGRRRVTGIANLGLSHALGHTPAPWAGLGVRVRPGLHFDGWAELAGSTSGQAEAGLCVRWWPSPALALGLLGGTRWSSVHSTELFAGLRMTLTVDESTPTLHEAPAQPGPPGGAELQSAWYDGRR